MTESKLLRNAAFAAVLSWVVPAVIPAASAQQ